MGHVACMHKLRSAKFWLEIIVGSGHLEDLSVDRRILLKYIL
jgi:hypothetical protein